MWVICNFIIHAHSSYPIDMRFSRIRSERKMKSHTGDFESQNNCSKYTIQCKSIFLSTESFIQKKRVVFIHLHAVNIVSECWGFFLICQTPYIYKAHANLIRKRTQRCASSGKIWKLDEKMSHIALVGDFIKVHYRKWVLFRKGRATLQVTYFLAVKASLSC